LHSRKALLYYIGIDEKLDSLVYIRDRIFPL